MSRVTFVLVLYAAFWAAAIARLTDGHGIFDSIGYAALASLCIAVVFVPIAGVFRRRWHEAGADPPEQPEPKTYLIGEKTFTPVKVNAPVMRQIMETVPAPPPPQVFGPFAVAQQWTPEYNIAAMESVYKQLAILLVDENNEHPDEDFLGVYLAISEASAMLAEILPTGE